MSTIKLGELVSIIGGGTPDRSNPDFWGGEIPWATVKDFKSLEISSTMERITDEGLKGSAANIVAPGSIIVPTRMALGKAAINTVPVAINQDLKALRVLDPDVLDRGYLFRFLLSKATYLESQGQGATVKGITLNVLRDLDVSVPPIREQQRVATILDKADSLRRKRQQAIRLADALRRSVFVQMFGDPDLNPKAWPILPMGDVIEFKGGSQPPKETFVAEPKPGYVRLVQIRDFKTDKYKTYIPEQLAKRSFDEDDVMVARYGPPVFQILRGLSGSYNVALMKAQPKPNVLKEFVFWLLQLPKYQSAVVSNSERTAGQTGVNLDFLNALDVPLPPLAFQQEIASAMVKISSTVEKQQAMLEESEKLLASLQSQYFDSRELV